MISPGFNSFAFSLFGKPVERAMKPNKIKQNNAHDLLWTVWGQRSSVKKKFCDT